ncbi:hypothetical protein J4Q44_G00069900 [Coregonus suidteri]|uniref:Integrase zinc-binding domain-containing protein n=1 Tax=Coregonus suidteri TaxID=861788 RepID=A0AAN8M098_9TELE
MYLRGKDRQPHRRVIFTKEAVLTEMHAGHFGMKRMIAKINLRFFWRGVVKDVDSWVSTCLACQTFERVKTGAGVEAHQSCFTMAHDRGGPHQTLHEIQEWHPLVSDGDRLIHQDKTGEATSKAMMEIFNTHGVPEVWMNGPTRPSILPWASPLTGTRNGRTT